MELFPRYTINQKDIYDIEFWDVTACQVLRKFYMGCNMLQCVPEKFSVCIRSHKINHVHTQTQIRREGEPHLEYHSPMETIYLECYSRMETIVKGHPNS
jgi:hypothetical protein